MAKIKAKPEPQNACNEVCSSYSVTSEHLKMTCHSPFPLLWTSLSFAAFDCCNSVVNTFIDVFLLVLETQVSSMSIQFLASEIGSASLLQGAIPDPEAKCRRSASDFSGVDWPLCTFWPWSPLGPVQSIEEASVKFLVIFQLKGTEVMSVLRVFFQPSRIVLLVIGCYAGYMLL